MKQIWIGALSLALVGLAGCGAKTGLTVPDAPMDAPPVRDGGPDGPDTPPMCVPGEFEIVPASAEVVFAIDRSGSMRLTIDGIEGAPPEMWRWRILRDALSGAFDTLDARVRVGAKFYPDVIEEERPPPEVACHSSAGIDIAISATAEPAIIARFDLAEPLGGTPTAVAIAESSAALRLGDSPRRFIVLATDGGPNCNSDPRIDHLTCICTSAADQCLDPDVGVFSCLDDVRTVDTIRMTASAGIPVFVVGIEDLSRPDLADVLDAMAVAGGRPRTVPGERAFYSIRSAAELRAALDTITGSISRCAFVSPSVPVDESTFFVEIDGTRIPRDSWVWVDRARGELELDAASCALAQRPGASVIAVVDDCPDF